MHDTNEARHGRDIGKQFWDYVPSLNLSDLSMVHSY